MKLKLLYEDYHGGDVQSGGQFPTTALERSQSRKGVSDLFVHGDDPGQQGVVRNKKIDVKEVEKSWSKARNAPKSHEIAFLNNKRFTGNKNRVMINVDLNDPNNSGYVTHTHPISHGPGTILGALPSEQDLNACLNFAMRSHNDKMVLNKQIFINDPSDIEGMIIWHGNHYVVVVPGDKVNLNLMNQYNSFLKKHDFENSIATLKRMGFITEYGTK